MRFLHKFLFVYLIAHPCLYGDEQNVSSNENAIASMSNVNVRVFLDSQWVKGEIENYRFLDLEVDEEDKKGDASDTLFIIDFADISKLASFNIKSPRFINGFLNGGKFGEPTEIMTPVGIVTNGSNFVVYMYGPSEYGKDLQNTICGFFSMLYRLSIKTGKPEVGFTVSAPEGEWEVFEEKESGQSSDELSWEEFGKEEPGHDKSELKECRNESD